MAAPCGHKNLIAGPGIVMGGAYAKGYQQIATCGALGIWHDEEKEWEWEGCGEIPAAQYHPIVSRAKDTCA